MRRHWRKWLTGRVLSGVKLAFIWMAADIYAAFRDDSLFNDGQHLKQALNRLQQLAEQRPVAPFNYLNLMQMKMLREIGRMSSAECERDLQRVQDVRETSR